MPVMFLGFSAARCALPVLSQFVLERSRGPTSPSPTGFDQTKDFTPTLLIVCT